MSALGTSKTVSCPQARLPGKKTTSSIRNLQCRMARSSNTMIQDSLDGRDTHELSRNPARGLRRLLELSGAAVAANPMHEVGHHRDVDQQQQNSHRRQMAIDLVDFHRD